jgi:hypothetical protein
MNRSGYNLNIFNKGKGIAINNLGDVGIGTTSPTSSLHVSKSINGADYIAKIENSSSTGEINGLLIKKTNSNSDGANNDKLLDIQTSTSSVFMVLGSGKIGIGTSSPDSELTVAGNIHSREVKVTVNAGADFVFDDEYNLPKLEEIQDFINKNGHLPEIASAKDMEENGIHLSEMNIKLLQKIEELTLYTIEQQKEIEILKADQKKIKELEEKLNQLIQK